MVRGLQLFDYNMDGKIQRHELRRVLENYCFKFTDTQFDKLWMRYDFHHTGLVNYRDFLQRLGVNVKLQGKPPSNDVQGCKYCLWLLFISNSGYIHFLTYVFFFFFVFSFWSNFHSRCKWQRWWTQQVLWFDSSHFLGLWQHVPLCSSLQCFRLVFL